MEEIDVVEPPVVVDSKLIAQAKKHQIEGIQFMWLVHIVHEKCF
jgi:hypothetical protein